MIHVRSHLSKSYQRKKTRSFCAQWQSRPVLTNLEIHQNRSQFDLKSIPRFTTRRFSSHKISPPLQQNQFIISRASHIGLQKLLNTTPHEKSAHNNIPVDFKKSQLLFNIETKQLFPPHSTTGLSLETLQPFFQSSFENNISFLIKTNPFQAKLLESTSADGLKFRLSEPENNVDFRGPILYLQNLKMQSTEGWKEAPDWARRFVQVSGVKENDRVLDLFFGLGYCTLACLEKGAQYVKSFEKYSQVTELVKVNPWSPNLNHPALKYFTNIDLHHPKNFQATLNPEENEKFFDSILIDPPKQSVMKRIYNSPNYLEILSRTLKVGGTFVCYLPSETSLSPKFRGLSSSLRQNLSVDFQEMDCEDKSILIFKKK